MFERPRTETIPDAPGAYLFRDCNAQFIQAFVPTFEVHVNTPFNHRTITGAAGEELMLDSVNLTMGAHVVSHAISRASVDPGASPSAFATMRSLIWSRTFSPSSSN